MGYDDGASQKATWPDLWPSSSTLPMDMPNALERSAAAVAEVRLQVTP